MTELIVKLVVCGLLLCVVLTIVFAFGTSTIRLSIPPQRQVQANQFTVHLIVLLYLAQLVMLMHYVAICTEAVFLSVLVLLSAILLMALVEVLTDDFGCFHLFFVDAYLVGESICSFFSQNWESIAVAVGIGLIPIILGIIIDFIRRG